MSRKKPGQASVNDDIAATPRPVRAGWCNRLFVIALLVVLVVTLILWKIVETQISSEISLVFLAIVVGIALIFKWMRLS